MTTPKRFHTLAKKSKQKQAQTIQRLMARFTMLEHERPTSQYQLHIWAQQRQRILRQLERYGIVPDQPGAPARAENPPRSAPPPKPTDPNS